jgi:hypothetical protein
MLRSLQILIVLFFIGCSSQRQAPLVINIPPTYPPQYFPNNSEGNNQNRSNYYQENNNIEEEGEDEIDENEEK